MARKRASMREGPLAELFKATEAAQRQKEQAEAAPEPEEPHESTVEHVPTWEDEVEIQGILPTMYDKRLLHSREAVDILKENFGDLVFNTKIRKTVRYAEAPVKGQSVLGYEPGGDAAALYRDLAKEVLNGAKAREHA